MSEDTRQLEAARAAKEKARVVFSRLGRVCGVGITRQGDTYCVKVNLQEELATDCECPNQIDGVPVVVHVVGPIRKQDDQSS